MQATQEEEIKRALAVSAMNDRRVVLGTALARLGRNTRINDKLLAAFFALEIPGESFTSLSAVQRLRSRFNWNHPDAVSAVRKLQDLGWLQKTGKKTRGKSLWQRAKPDLSGYLTAAEELLHSGAGQQT